MIYARAWSWIIYTNYLTIPTLNFQRFWAFVYFFKFLIIRLTFNEEFHCFINLYIEEKFSFQLFITFCRQKIIEHFYAEFTKSKLPLTFKLFYYHFFSFYSNFSYKKFYFKQLMLKDKNRMLGKLFFK